ncbi:DnaB-like helicase C-terminal domain-containing protein [Bartonella sp. LJL80]
MSEKPPFNALEAEQALLGAVLLDNRLYHAIRPQLLPDHFCDPLHGQLWQWLGEMIDSGSDATPVSMKPFIADIQVGELSAYHYLVRLVTQAVGASQTQGFARAIFDCAARNRLIAMARSVEDQARHAGPGETAANLIQTAESALIALKESLHIPRQNNHRGAVVDRLMQRYQSRDKAATIPLPMPEISDVLSGMLEAGNLYGLLSSSGEGKTSLAMQIMDHAAASGHPVVFFSYDQSAEQCLMQMASQRLRLETRSIREQLLSKQDEKRYFSELMTLRKHPMQIVSCTAETIQQLISQLQPLLRTKPELTPLVVVDHVRKIAPMQANSHEGRIAAEIGGMAKAVAREHKLVWLNIMQRKSLRETRENPHPNDSDLFGGEQAREDYDAILYLYRPEKYRTYRLSRASSAARRDAICQYLHKWQGKSKLGALKVRFGDPTIWRPLAFEAEFTRYASLVPDQQPVLEGL